MSDDELLTRYGGAKLEEGVRSLAPELWAGTVVLKTCGFYSGFWTCILWIYHQV